MEREIIKYRRFHGLAFAENDIPKVFPPHWHNEAEFIVVLKNGCKYKIDGNVYEPKAGDLVLVWPRELHELICIPPDGVVFIQFSSYLIESNSDLSAASHFMSDCHLIRQKENPELAKKIRDLIYKIKATREKEIFFAESHCKILVYEILLLVGELVLTERSQSLGPESFSDKSWEYIRFACSYIAEHSRENISQSEVAEKIGLSQYYFSKLFNEYTKMSFPSYLASIRVQNAINLLENERLSITDCAFEAGFQSITTFNKLFHEQTGCSPREYRKLHSQNKEEEKGGKYEL